MTDAPAPALLNAIGTTVEEVNLSHLESGTLVTITTEWGDKYWVGVLRQTEHLMTTGTSRYVTLGSNSDRWLRDITRHPRTHEVKSTISVGGRLSFGMVGQVKYGTPTVATIEIS